MAGIYIHIPYCKQACSYCDFHFSTSHKSLPDLVDSIIKEINLRKEYLRNEGIETIYFGGGTPSLLPIEYIDRIFESIYTNFAVSNAAEITMEANPDDLTTSYIRSIKHTPINRLSIGIQSFDDAHLIEMNRAHNSKQALRCVPEVMDMGIEDVSIDLIYGIQGMGMLGWKKNVEIALNLPINHLSSYCLTVEPKTILAYKIANGSSVAVNDEDAVSQYEYLLEVTEAAGIPWYEVSNFSKPGKASKHNSSYWEGIPYLGIGPSAHSFDGKSRQWNIKSNSAYIQQLTAGKIPAEIEILNSKDKFNENILTSLRTRKGLSLMAIRNLNNEEEFKRILLIASNKAHQQLLTISDEKIVLTRKGLLFADAIAAEFFIA
jgi:oxygen-independent coproporphyrinogen-3 oxidase